MLMSVVVVVVRFCINPYAAASYLSSVLPGSANFHQLVRDYS